MRIGDRVRVATKIKEAFAIAEALEARPLIAKLEELAGRAGVPLAPDGDVRRTGAASTAARPTPGGILPRTVSVERGRYELTTQEVQQVLEHVLSMAQVEMEDKVALQSAVAALAQGFDFADALHHASYRTCASVATFDDNGFARRTKKLGLKPAVHLLT